MAIVIKEIEVKTIVEKRVIRDYEIPNNIYTKITDEVVSRVNKSKSKQHNIKKRER